MALNAQDGSKRTVVVLTKPDMIEEHCHERWMDLMRGKDLQLDLVRQKRDTALYLTFEIS